MRSERKEDVDGGCEASRKGMEVSGGAGGDW